MSDAHDDDYAFASHSSLDQTNLFGTDTHDHAPDHWRHDSEHESHRSGLMEADPFDHITNIDGTPMCGDIDIHGNAYGVTDWHSDSWDIGGMSSSSMFD